MKDRITSRALLFGILVLFAMLTVPSVSAHDADAIYFLPEDIRVSGCGTTETVAIWINASVALGGGVAEFSYDSSCANVTAYDPNTDWNLVNDAGFTTGNLKIGFSRNGVLGPGLVNIGDITINCTDCASACCGTKLVWNTTSSYIQDSGGAGVPANWVNGTFVCGEPLVVEKTVWDESTSSWVDTLELTSDWKDKDAIFNITLTAGCLDLSNVMVFDVMAAGLQYNNSATPGEDASTAQTANWTTLGTLAAGASTSIEFNATIDGYGPQDNTANANATVDELSGLGVQASDTATVDTCPPAGINVTKTVWDESTSSWVDMLTDATIDDTYRFRCEVENIGSLGMDVCDITVTDVLPVGLSYADNAMLQDHHGVWWSLPDPPGINDPANNTYGWIIDNTVPGECLQVGQKIVVEYDVTVENYGISCNNITAEAYCSSATSWVYGNDSACIDTPAPDLTVTDIEVNYDGSSCGGEAFGPLPPNGTNTQPNNISADITELNGIAVVFPFDVTFEIRNASAIVATHTAQLPSITAGATETVYCDNIFFPIAGENYTINVTVDSADDVIETDENNNLMQLVKTAIVNGYKGGLWQDGRTIGKMNCIQGNINIVRSLGDSSYVSSYYHPNWTDYDVVWDSLPIPTAGTSIKKARLYVYHQTDKTPEKNITEYFKLEFNGYELPIVASFNDSKGFGSSDWTSPVGMIAYDVSHKVQIGNINIANLTNQVPGGGNVTISGMMLIVVYENSEEPERMIWINEGLDLLYAKDVYNVNSTEATAHGAFTDCYPIPANMSKATLVTVAPLGNSVTSTKLFFNGHEFLGAWPAYSGSTHVCLAEHDVSSYLSSTANTFAFQSYKPAGAIIGDFMAASNAILIVEGQNSEMSAEPVPSASGKPCYDVGEEFDVLINITPKGESIMGAEFDLYFNKSVIFAETVTYGGFLTQDGHTSIYLAESVVDNDNGVVMFAASRQSTGDGVTEPGTFAIVHFTAVAEGQTSYLNLVDALAANNGTPVETLTLATIDGSATVCFNEPPIAVAKSGFTYNNIAERGLSKAYFSGTESHDYEPDGDLTLWNWWVDDGTDLIGENVVHLFEAPIYWQPMGDPNGGYVPADVTLTVTDDGMPLKDGLHTIPVTVWIAGDTTGDGRVNIADTVPFGRQFGEHADVNPAGLHWHDNLEGDQADLNNDDWVNIGDATLLGTAWGHTAW